MPRPLRFVAAALLLILAVPAPAFAAAPGPVTVAVDLPNITMPAGDDQQSVEVNARLAPDRARAARVQFTVDFRAAADVVELEPYSVQVPQQLGCTRDGYVFTCTLTGPVAGGAEFRLANLVYRARTGAPAGTSGTMTVTARADDGPASTVTARIRLGERVDLFATHAYARIEPGTSGEIRPQVRNIGTTAINGAVAAITVHPDLIAEERFANCTYGEQVVCAFDDVLEPGAEYVFSPGLLLAVPADAARASQTSGPIEWVTVDQWADREIPPGRPGEGPDVHLVKVEPGPAAQRVPQADDDPIGNFGGFIVVAGDGNAEAEVAVFSTTLTGRVGDRVSGSVGVVNRGPGTMYRDYFPLVNTPVSVYFPDGLTIVRADRACVVEPNYRQSMVCDKQPAVWRPGPPLRYAFTVAFGEDATGDDGVARIVDFVLPVNIADGSFDDNSVLIPITLRGPAGGPGGGSGGGTGGGGLPITGAAAGPTALAGLILVVTGTALLLIGRRRKAA